MVRQKMFRIGQRVRLRDSTLEGANAYPLPEGWAAGEEVTVLGIDHGWVRVASEGKETDVYLVNIECGWERLKNGKWVTA